MHIFNFDEFLKEKKEKPCWDGYTMVGMKKKSGKEIPNCVPNKKKKVDEPSKQNESNKKDSLLKNVGVKGYNKPKRTPNHPTKSHVVVAKNGDKVKTIRFGEQGAETAGKPKEGESERMKMKRKSFKARHGANIKKGKMSAAYWADKVKW